MKNSVFCNKNLIKYLIIVGLVYAILKMIPSEQMSNKDLMLIMIIIVLGLFSLDCAFLVQYKENFNNHDTEEFTDEDIEEFEEDTEEFADVPAKASPKKALKQSDSSNNAPKGKGKADNTDTSDATAPKGKGKRKAPVDAADASDANVIKGTRKDIRDPTAAIALNAGESLNVPANYTPNRKPTPTPTVNPQGKCAPSPCAAEVEALKKQLEAQINTLKDQLQTSSQQKVNNDFRYNELPLEMYVPLGDKVANQWSTDNAYAMLNTNQWQVPMPRPPVCINTEPCKVCPSDEGNYGQVPLTKFDSSRKITNTNINRGWANDQQSS